MSGENIDQATGRDGDPGAGTAPGNKTDTVGHADNAPQFDKVAVIGNAIWLMTQSPAHKHLFMADLVNLLIPPVALQQYRVWRERGLPVAFATWGFLNADAERRLRTDFKSLKSDDWSSGDHLWLMDLIAPFGGQEKLIEELRDTAFKGRRAKSLQPSPTGGTVEMEI